MELELFVKTFSMSPTCDTAVVAPHFVSEDPGFPFLEMQVRVEDPNHPWSILGEVMNRSAFPAP